jgi:hypothetical protein
LHRVTDQFRSNLAFSWTRRLKRSSIHYYPSTSWGTCCCLDMHALKSHFEILFAIFAY